MRERFTDEQADYEAELAREFDVLTPEQQEEFIEDQKARAFVAAERRAERALCIGYGS